MVDDLVLRDVHRRGLMLLDGMMRDNLIVNSDLSASANKFGEYVQMWDQYFEKIKGAKEKPSPEKAREYLQEMVTPSLEERIAEMYPGQELDNKSGSSDNNDRTQDSETGESQKQDSTG